MLSKAIGKYFFLKNFSPGSIYTKIVVEKGGRSDYFDSLDAVSWIYKKNGCGLIFGYKM